MEERKKLQEEVGKRVRQLRKRRGMTMAALAEAADISVQYVSEIEHGKKSMTMGRLLRVARALGVSTDRLLLGEGGGDHTMEDLTLLLESMSPLDRDLALHTLRQLVALLESFGPERD